MLLLLVVSPVFASGGLFATSHVNGLTMTISGGYNYKQFMYTSGKTNYTQQNIPLDLNFSWLFGSDNHIGMSLGCEFKYPVSLKVGEEAMSYGNFNLGNVIFNPYLLFLAGTETFDGGFGFTGGIGAKLDMAHYPFQGSTPTFTTIELEGQLHFKFAMGERYNFSLLVRGGYGMLNWIGSNFVTPFSSDPNKGSAWSISATVGITYEF